MRTTPARWLLPALTLLGSTGCKDLGVPDFYAGSIADLEGGNATPTQVATAAQGLLIGARSVAVGTSTGGYVITWGEVGREGYGLDPAYPPANSQRLKIPDQSMADGTWSAGYRTLRQASVLLHAVDGVASMSASDKEAIRGWTKTLMAHALLILINTFDQSGAAIDFDRAVNDPLSPIATRAEVFARIVQLLDEAKTHLLASGATFPFTPSPGFSGFDTPTTFLQVNRAIKARVDVYLQDWPGAIADLNDSFIDTTEPMSAGAYHSYSTLSGDEANPLYDPVPRTQVAHQSTIPDAQLRADQTPDLRATQKTAAIPTRLTNGIQVDRKWTIYQSGNDPVPIIKNEELLLLRAEANIHLGNDQASLDDINLVRSASGGLDPITLVDWQARTPDQKITELLYNRRYSLLWEGGHRWLDARRYGLLGQLPKYAPDHVIIEYAPLPTSECIARNPEPPGCNLPPVL